MISASEVRSESVTIDGRVYELEVKSASAKSADVTRILIPAWQPNDTAKRLLDICITSIQNNTPAEDYELWVVDNCSGSGNAEWLLGLDDVNVVLSRTQPRPPERRGFLSRLAFWQQQKEWGSYANAIGLELGLKFIPPESKHLLTLHMDTIMCRPDWLSVLKDKLNENVRASGVCFEKIRNPEGVLHVLGMLFDYQLYKDLRLDFFPEMPEVDVGDKVSLEFRKNGYGLQACRNTYEYPDDANKIDPDSPYSNFTVMRVLDDSNNVIFMHLGRGIRKSDNSYVGQSAAADEWIGFYNAHISDSGKGG